MAEEQLKMLHEQTKIIKMQRQMLSDQKKLGLLVNEPAGEEEMQGEPGNTNQDFTLKTELPRLVFNTNISIKTKKRDAY